MLRLPFAGRRRRISRSVRRTAAAILSPLPTVQVQTGPWVPAWLLRFGCGVFGVGVMLLLGAGGPAVVLLSAFLIAVLVRPSARTGGLFCLIAALVWTVLPTQALSGRTIGILALVPAVLWLATAIDAVPVISRVEFRALGPSLRRFLITQLISQPVVIAAASLGEVSGKVPLALPLSIGGAAVVGVAAWLLLPRLNR